MNDDLNKSVNRSIYAMEMRGISEFFCKEIRCGMISGQSVSKDDDVEDWSFEFSNLRITQRGNVPEKPVVVAQGSSDFLGLPVEMRAKIYTFLLPKDFVILRSVCRNLYWESSSLGCFNVFMKPRSIFQTPDVPFSKLQYLFIDNDREDLPWGAASGDTVETMILRNVTYKTLEKLGSGSLKLKQITLKPNLFCRPFPSLNWSELNNLRLQFLVPLDKDEWCMLDNLDTLFEQNFPSLKTLVISFANARAPNLQSKYSVRVARFMAKHFKHLKQFSLSMEARRCCQRHFVTPPQAKSALYEEEFLNFTKVQLSSLELNMSEITCAKCVIFRTFIQHQNNLKALHVHVSGAEKLPTMFFCNLEKLDQFVFLEFITIRLWGSGDFYPLDFRYLRCAKKLSCLEFGRYAEARIQLSQPELLNVDEIPGTIQVLSLSGFLISCQDVHILLEKLRSVTSFTLLDCGSGPGGVDVGVTIEHIPSLGSHTRILIALIDFNGIEPNARSSLRQVEKAFEKCHGFPYLHKHLYDVGFNQHHRFEFNRIPDSGQLEAGGNSSSARIFLEEDDPEVFGKFYPYETFI